MATATLSVRTDKSLKTEVGRTLRRLGLTHSTAINIFYHKIKETNGIPFDLRVPNETTLRALENSRKGKVKRFAGTDELFKDLGI